MYVMWLTVIFPDLCRYVYTYTTLPPVAPARPSSHTQLPALCKVMTCGESTNHASVHQHTEGISNINYLLVYDNCYGISCHSLECMKLLHYHTEGVLQCRCTKYHTHHLWWSLHDPTSRVHTRSLRSSGLPIEITVQCWTLYHIRSIWHLCNTIVDAAWTEASREFSAPVS